MQSRLFSDSALGVMSNVMNSAMDDTADVHAISTTRKRGGGYSRGEPQKIASYPCSLRFASDAVDDLKADAMTLDARYVVYLPVDANVQAGHRLVVRGTLTEGGEPRPWQKTVDVLGVSAPHTHRVRRVAFCSEDR